MSRLSSSALGVGGLIVLWYSVADGWYSVIDGNSVFANELLPVKLSRCFLYNINVAQVTSSFGHTLFA